MKLLKPLAVFILCVSITLGFSGCNFEILSLFEFGSKGREEKTPKVAFGWEISENYNGVTEIKSREEIEMQETEYAPYKSDFHYSKLTEDEKFLYRCFEYALEKGYPCVYVDDRITPTADAFGKVLDFLALDSPLLEQNLMYETGTFTTYYETGPFKKAKLDGVYLNVENIDPVLWDGKLDAVKRAKEIVEDMPENLSEIEKAKYLHRYTVENTEYYDYNSSDGVWQYLHDAVTEGKANCDGSANMLSLLLNTAGIECFEKMHTGNIVGHTWNMVKLDGVWYNVDATAQNKTEAEDINSYLKRNFAFEDCIQKYIPDYNEIYPAVTDGLQRKTKIHIESIDKDDFCNLVKTSFAESGENYGLFLIDNYNEAEANTAMQRLADSLKTKVYWYSYSVADNKTLMAVYK